MPDDVGIPAPRVQLPMPPPGGTVPVLYVNAVGVRGGAFDITLDLGYSVPPNPPADAETPPSVDWLARVTMSWEHATVLARVLAGAVEKYEEQIGQQLPDLESLRVSEQP